MCFIKHPRPLVFSGRLRESTLVYPIAIYSLAVKLWTIHTLRQMEKEIHYNQRHLSGLYNPNEAHYPLSVHPS